MTFVQWWKKWWKGKTSLSENQIAHVAWDAALAESGTRELYEACKEIIRACESPSRQLADVTRREIEPLHKMATSAIAKYESSV
jgi:hypothetical protein